MLPDAGAPHCERGADDCFGCKMRHMRRDGVRGVCLPTHFKAATAGGYTQRELGREIIESAKAEGREIERVR